LKDRLDKIMSEKGLVTSRSQAKSLIEKGDVTVSGRPVRKAGEMVETNSEIIISSPAYVGRGAFKLEMALKEFQIDVHNLVMLDVGSSTGGFTEILLLNGAKKVYAIDVGRDQLVEKLKRDPRVISMEGTNIRELDSLPEIASGAVVDLSFISVTKVLNSIAPLLVSNGFAIILIKPQFEAGLSRLPKDGVIKDEKVRAEILEEVLSYVRNSGWEVISTILSPIVGKTGNTEYLSLIKKI
jgi:23S rRNA (cytidine1920-2'-O)/16S rRNA (cytidine1409-2'-O)-methyltransferase